MSKLLDLFMTSEIFVLRAVALTMLKICLEFQFILVSTSPSLAANNCGSLSLLFLSSSSK